MKITIWIFFWKLPFPPIFPYIFVKGTDDFSDDFSKSRSITQTFISLQTAAALFQLYRNCTQSY